MDGHLHRCQRCHTLWEHGVTSCSQRGLMLRCPSCDEATLKAEAREVAKVNPACGKTRYKSKGAAASAVRKRKYGSHAGRRPHQYLCDDCHYWHNGGSDF